ncbi:MAG: DUF2264 domain-containing protein [Lachnospiraceae bacterium]|nr:DUF2264 domain-containing protein [Lachnospiraceae bacterium]
MKFIPRCKDYNLSPYTGLTRSDWIDAAKYILEGVFKNIKDIDTPVVLPRRETEITYPHSYSDPKWRAAEERAEMFEGLTRTFFIAAPLIALDENIEIAGIKLRDYYAHQVLRSCNPTDPICVGTYESLIEMTQCMDPFRPFQQTVETSALVICLWTCKEKLWDRYSKEQKDIVATFLQSFAKAATVPQNWRLFNMLDMAFLSGEGYEIDADIMRDHACAVLDYYAGDGWYRDGQCFDYYSCWAFNFYGPMWCEKYGYEHEPYVAAKIEEYSNKLMESYDRMFDRDGFTNMWGRSNIYRFAAVSAFDGNFYLRDSKANPGLARRISSGSLMQFLGRDDFMWNGIPTMGFYGQFAPLVQGYSCTESVYWMGKAFLCLHLPEDHPFWTTKEEGGVWDTLSESETSEMFLEGPGLMLTAHGGNGETTYRTAKVLKAQNDIHGMDNYSKLSYNTKYPWEAQPDINLQPDAKPLMAYKKGDVASQQYVLMDGVGGYTSYCNATFLAGVRDGILYRKQFFDFSTKAEYHWMQSMFLADFSVPLGTIRVDKLKLFRRPVVLTLGSYGFPDNGTSVNVLRDGAHTAVVLKGKDSLGNPKQMAMTIFAGFSDLLVTKSCGTNPDSEKSLVVFGQAAMNKPYGGGENYVYVSQVITRNDDKDFTDEELFPIEYVEFTDGAGGVFGPVKLIMKDGSVKNIDYEQMEGRLML